MALIVEKLMVKDLFYSLMDWTVETISEGFDLFITILDTWVFRVLFKILMLFGVIVALIGLSIIASPIVLLWFVLGIVVGLGKSVGKLIGIGR